MLLSAVSVLVVAQSSSEIPEGLMNNPVYSKVRYQCTVLPEEIILLSHLRRKSEASEIVGNISNWCADRAAPVCNYTANFISSKFDKVLYLHKEKLVFPGILSRFLATTLVFFPFILAHVKKKIYF